MTLPQQNIASARPTSFYYLMCQLDRVQYHIARVYSYIVYYGYSMIRFTTGDMTSLGIIRLVMFSNDYQKKEMISYD